MKKLGALFLGALLLISLTNVAYAVPDRMTTYMLQAIRAGEAYSFTVGDDTAPGEAVRQSIYDAVENYGVAPVDWWERDFFGVPVKDAAQALTGANVEEMSLCSFASVDLSGFNPEISAGEKIGFHFTNTYPAGLEFVAVVGALKDGVQDRLSGGEAVAPIELYDWQALAAKPDAAGDIEVDFTRAALTMMNDKDAVVALLCQLRPGSYSEAAAPSDTPSKTVSDITTIRIESGKDGYILKIVPHTQLSQAEFDKIYQYLIIEGERAINYFDADTRARIAALLPENFDTETLVVNEYASCVAHNYDYAHGEVVALASFPTRYARGIAVVAMVGVFGDDGETIWTPQRAEVADGSVRIFFTQNVMTRLEENPCALLILNEAGE